MISKFTLNTNVYYLSDQIKELGLYSLFAVLIWASFLGAFAHPLINTNRFLLLSFVVLSIILLNRRLVSFCMPWAFGFYILFAILALASFLYSYDTSLTIIEFRHIIISILVFTSTYNFASSKKRIVTLMNLYIVLLIFYAFYLFTYSNVFSLGARFHFEEKSYNVIMLEFLMGVIFCFISATLTNKKLKYYVLSAFFVAIIIATGSVKGFIATGFFIVLSFIPTRIKVQRKFHFRISIRRIWQALIFIFIFGGSILFFVNKGFLDRGVSRSTATIMFLISNDIENGERAAGSVHGFRTELTNYGIEFWKEHALFGAGINNYRYLIEKRYGLSTYSHSTPIELLVGTGLVGFFLYFLFIISIFCILFYSYIKTKEHYILLFIYGFTTLILISFGQRMYADIYQFFYIALILSFIKTKLPPKGVKISPIPRRGH